MSEALIARLIEAGTPAALVAEVAMEIGRLQGAQDILERRRANDRERKRVDTQLPRNSTESTESVEFQEGAGKKESPPDPHKKNTPLKTSLREVTPQRLADDFVMPADWIEWAMAKRGWSNAEAVEEGECFCRYWQAKGRDAAKRSWKKTWQNWVVSSRRGQGSGPGPASSTDLDALMASVQRKYGGNVAEIATRPAAVGG